MIMQEIILASQSPRRKQLLEWAEIRFTVIVPDTDESYPAAMVDFTSVAIHIAQQKAKAVQEISKQDLPVLAADTIVVCNNEIIGKPANREEAIATLKKLSGVKHQVITGVSILSKNKEMSFADTTDVTFNELTTEQIEFYVDKYLPYDKAGAYAIQEWIGVVGIKSVQGDFYNVMGLPVNRVVQALKELF
jgi:septum formation protein